ncbi:hypothetical protein PR202_gb19851 [Eleusine coracana subsp. coracana]|uniref:Uncharacterized protein n=1 Tax=Eleusine coracana subsp. coracana TaxID=191504 RepID=A0AAV5F988_ELECO|nr:hypothetical protein QOZ80_3BG0280290 [Eleusine coracana subsp. coracana]GJN31451.1 hypothetical protein PR202_gb19851 [Eleusine coracana subsp. coracana]
MPSPRLRALLLTSAAVLLSVVASATAEWTWSAAELGSPSSFHGRLAAEWASSSDDESCWGSPEECPVVYDLDTEDVGGDAAGLGRRRLQYYYDVNTASTLPTTQYISYSALMRDSVPCSVPGASYYNCQPGADANPYTRGCSAIAQCRD